MFTFSIPLSESAIESIKSDLRQAMSEVKSSHRVEAVARGLGFRTYAAMRAASKSLTTHLVEPDGSRFTEYLAQHGFEVDSIHLYRSAAHVAVNCVLDMEPRLSMRGYGFQAPQRKSDGGFQTPRETYKEFCEARDEFHSKYSVDQFLLALGFVSRIMRTKTVRPNNGSYGLKHIAENYGFELSDGRRFGPHYVSSGALLAAAVYAGFHYKSYLDPWGYDAINVSFNMSRRSIDELDREIRPRQYAA